MSRGDEGHKGNAYGPDGFIALWCSVDPENKKQFDASPFGVFFHLKDESGRFGALYFNGIRNNNPMLDLKKEDQETKKQRREFWNELIGEHVIPAINDMGKTRMSAWNKFRAKFGKRYDHKTHPVKYHEKGSSKEDEWKKLLKSGMEDGRWIPNPTGNVIFETRYVKKSKGDISSSHPYLSDVIAMGMLLLLLLLFWKYCKRKRKTPKSMPMNYAQKLEIVTTAPVIETAEMTENHLAIPVVNPLRRRYGPWPSS